MGPAVHQPRRRRAWQIVLGISNGGTRHGYDIELSLAKTWRNDVSLVFLRVNYDFMERGVSKHEAELLLDWCQGMEGGSGLLEQWNSAVSDLSIRSSAIG